MAAFPETTPDPAPAQKNRILLSIAEASQLIQAHTPPPRSESIPLQSALHRVLASSIAVPEPCPAFTKSLMDGYAIDSQAASDTNSDTLVCKVAQTLTAGQIPPQHLPAGQAVHIMTGAMLPDNCDCVVPQELARTDPGLPGSVLLPRGACRPGASVLPAGALALPGDALLAAGTLLQPRHIAALAEFGFSCLHANAIPTAAIISTGSELVPFHLAPPPGMLRNSSQPLLATLMQSMGARVVSLQTAADDPVELEAAIHAGLQADLLLLTGGVSVGLLDLVPATLRKAGVRQLLHGVKLKPGKPLWAGLHKSPSHDTLVFGLPGNPVSSLACCELFVRPAIRQMLGRPPATPLSAELNHECSLQSDRPVCQPASAEIRNGKLTVKLVPWQLSADLRSAAAANCMVLLEPQQSPRPAGSSVPVWLWDDQIH